MTIEFSEENENADAGLFLAFHKKKKAV